MIYKIGFFLGAALIAILAVENMVVGTYAYLFLDPSASVGILVLVSAIIGVVMGYCIPHVFSQKNDDADDDSFNF